MLLGTMAAVWVVGMLLVDTAYERIDYLRFAYRLRLDTDVLWFEGDDCEHESDRIRIADILPKLAAAGVL